MIKRIIKWIAFKIVYPVAYKIGCIKKQNPKKIIFAEVRHSFLTDSYKLIYDEIKALSDYDAEIVYLYNNKGGLSYLLRYLKLCFKMGSAGCILCDDTCNLFGAFRLRKNTKLIQTWHSCGAFKKWGECISDLSFGDDISEIRKYPAHINYTLCTVSSEECIWAFREAFGLPDDNQSIRAIGVSRTDIFFKDDSRKLAFESFENACPDGFSSGKKVLLYAPTYRGDADKAQTPYELDLEKMCENLSDEYILLIKHHGFIKDISPVPEKYERFAFDVSKSMNIEHLLFIADVCITDYSSLIFEYSLFEKPMLFFAFDLDDFYDYRGFFYDYKDFVPGPIVKTTDELIKEIKDINNYDKDKIKEFQNKFMGACDGHSTERIIDYITNRSRRTK